VKILRLFPLIVLVLLSLFLIAAAPMVPIAGPSTVMIMAADPVTIPELSTAGIVAVVSILFSLAFLYIPGIRVKFAGIAKEAQQGVFLLTALVVGVAWFILPSLGVCQPQYGLVCEPVTAGAAIYAFLGVILGGGAVQGFYRLLPQPGDVVAAREARDA
jgi:hypothetical protein